jgi:hypothetical protein
MQAAKPRRCSPSAEGLYDSTLAMGHRQRGPDGHVFRVVRVRRGLGTYKRWSRVAEAKSRSPAPCTRRSPMAGGGALRKTPIQRAIQKRLRELHKTRRARDIKKRLRALTKLGDGVDDLLADIAASGGMLLTMRQATAVAKGKLALAVVQPQGYYNVSTLDSDDWMFEPFGEGQDADSVGYFKATTPYGSQQAYASSGSGSDLWIVANSALYFFLDRRLRRMTAHRRKAASAK